MAILLPAPLACCRFELEQRQMTPPSNFALWIIVEGDAKLVRSLNAYYSEAAPAGGLEALDRDACWMFSAGTSPGDHGLAPAAWARGASGPIFEGR